MCLFSLPTCIEKSSSCLHRSIHAHLQTHTPKHTHSDPDLEGKWPLKRHITEFYASDLNLACSTDPRNDFLLNQEGDFSQSMILSPNMSSSPPLPSSMEGFPHVNRPGSASEASIDEELMVSSRMCVCVCVSHF